MSAPKRSTISSGRDDVALALAHLRAVAVDHPLREQAGERLARRPTRSDVVQHLGEEARVQQVQDRVLDAADVLVDRQPVVDDLALERRPRTGAGPCSAGSTRTSPRRCPWCRSRAGPVRRRRGRSSSTNVRVGGERALALGGVVVDLRQQDRAAGRRGPARPRTGAVDHRDRCAPVALARDEPVAQAVADGGLAQCRARRATRRSAALGLVHLRARRGSPSSPVARRRRTPPRAARRPSRPRAPR